MIFNSAIFAAFILVLWPSYWLIKSRSWRHGLLLVASFAFYGWWDWRFLILLSAVIAVAYFGGLGIAWRRDHCGCEPRWVLAISVSAVLVS